MKNLTIASLLALLMSMGAWSSNLLEGTAFINESTKESFKFLEDNNFIARLEGFGRNETITGYYEERLITGKATGLDYDSIYLKIYFDSSTCIWYIERKGNFLWFDFFEKTGTPLCSDLLVKQIVPIDREKHFKLN